MFKNKNIVFPKIFVLLLLFTLPLALLAQSDYTLTRHTFNAAGGHQSNSNYSVTSAVAPRTQGEAETADYDAFLGFLFPQLDIRSPLITSIDDVPHDQGHQVQIVWDKCGYDDYYAVDTYYSIWRWDEDMKNVDPLLFSPPTRSLAPSQSRSLTPSPNRSLAKRTFSQPWKVVEQYRKDPTKLYFWNKAGSLWTFVDEVPALQNQQYSYIAPTLLDSTASSYNYATFKVVYHDTYEAYESVPDSGYSADNIPPDPTVASINQNAETTNLSWNEVTTGTYQGNSYEELNGVWYKIYIGNTPEFPCDESHYIDTVTDLNFNYSATGESKKFFKVVVSDQPPQNN